MASDHGREDKGRAPSTSFQAMDKNAEVEVGCCSAGLVWGRVWLNQEQERRRRTMPMSCTFGHRRGHEWHCKVLGAIGHQMAWDKNQWLPKIKCYNFAIEVKGWFTTWSI